MIALCVIWAQQQTHNRLLYSPQQVVMWLRYVYVCPQFSGLVHMVEILLEDVVCTLCCNASALLPCEYPYHSAHPLRDT